jgi:hypothetical protein
MDRGATLSASVTGLPTDGRPLYVRLWYLRSGAWLSLDYTLTAATVAAGGGTGGGGTTNPYPQLTSPAPASALAGTSQVFQWTAAASTTQYWLTIGNTAGARDVADIDSGANLWATVSSLPSDGRTLYVRLWFLRLGSWTYVDSTVTAMSSAGTGGTGSGGGTTAAPQMLSPAPGSVLPGATVTFQWTASLLTTQYWLTMGTLPGLRDLLDLDRGLNVSATLNNLPTDGRTIYVRLWYLRLLQWTYVDFQYTAANTASAGAGTGGTGGTGTTVVPQMITPVPGTTLAGSTQVFQWTAAQYTTQYWIQIGNAVGTKDVADVNAGSNLAATITGLPRDGRTLYVRVWYFRNSQWTYLDFTLRASPV